MGATDRGINPHPEIKLTQIAGSWRLALRDAQQELAALKAEQKTKTKEVANGRTNSNSRA
jgi:hypothetical protein